METKETWDSVMAEEFTQLQAIGKTILEKTRERCEANPPPVLRILMDHLNIVGMALQQLDQIFYQLEVSGAAAAEDLASGGTGVVNG